MTAADGGVQSVVARRRTSKLVDQPPAGLAEGVREEAGGTDTLNHPRQRQLVQVLRGRDHRDFGRSGRLADGLRRPQPLENPRPPETDQPCQRRRSTHRSACCSFASRLPGCQQGTAWVAAPMFDQRAAAHLACGRGLICSHSTRPERKHVCASLAVGWALAAAAAPLSEIAGTAARRRCRAVSRLESVSSCSRVASAGG